MKFFLLIVIFTCQNALSQSLIIDQFLNEVKDKSLLFNETKLEAESNKVTDQAELNAYDLNGQVSYNYFDLDEVSYSPFSPLDNNKNTYKIDLSKKWSSGVTTGLNYSLLDNITNYPNGNKLDYKSPDLSLSLRSSIVSDIFYQKNRHQKLKVDAKLKLNDLQLQSQQKNILTESLLTMAQVLKLKNQIQFQSSLCTELKNQASKLYNKSKNGAINKRDYYLSLKKRNSCEIQVKNFETQKDDHISKLEIDYGVSFEKYKGISLTDVSDLLLNLYRSDSYQASKVQINNNLRTAVLKQQKDFLQHHQKQLQADSKIPINVEVKIGAKGLDDKISPSHQEIIDFNNPYISGTVSLDLPLKNKQKNDNLRIITYQQKILENKLLLTDRQNKKTFERLSEKINSELENLKNLKLNVDYSRSALRLARRDFNNGRIDFLVLSDFQASLIESQLQQSHLQLNLISDILSYLDYFNFLERYQ